MKQSLDEISWGLVQDTLKAYDVHFRIMFGLDSVLINHLGVESTEEFKEKVIPYMVEKGLYPTTKDGKPIWEPEDLDKMGGVGNLEISSAYFAMRRAYAQLEAEEYLKKQKEKR